MYVMLAGCGFAPTASQAIDAHDAEPIDAPDAHVIDGPPDAAVFDPALCPVGYAQNGVTASPMSRYRLIDTTAVFAVQNADCNDDHPGWTHLVAIDTPTEGQQIRDNMTTSTFYVGAVQMRNETQVATAWFLFTGPPVPAATWQGSEPNDNNGSENNEQNLAAADSSSSGNLNDVAGTFMYRAVCECDGIAIPSTIATAIQDNTP
jgi:hypothetical protein